MSIYSNKNHWFPGLQMQDLYKTVWEIKQRVVLDMAADRGKYIDQSQSLPFDRCGATDGSSVRAGWPSNMRGMFFSGDIDGESWDISNIQSPFCDFLGL